MAVSHRNVNPSPGLLTIKDVLFCLDFQASVETVLSLGEDSGQEVGYCNKCNDILNV